MKAQTAPAVHESRALDFLRVYPVTDRSAMPPEAFLPAVEAALAGGARCLQLREKDLDGAALLQLARAAQRLTAQYGAKLFINSRADIAWQAAADGVHLPENGFSIMETKQRFPHLMVGASAHSLERALAAEREGADFITFSPIYDTPSKRAYGPPQGLERLRAVASQLHIPVLALGGIRRGNVPEVLAHGAFGVALISGIWNSPDIKQETACYTRFFMGEKS